MKAQRIQEIIFETFDQLMAQNENLTLAKSADLPLTGEGSALDSLGLVNFLVALEQNIKREHRTDVTIADQELIIGESQPLRTVSSLTAFLEKKLQE